MGGITESRPSPMMLMDPTPTEIRAGHAELLSVRQKSRWLYWIVAVFSSVVNVLMLTGPLYMLNVFGSVLVSRSVETLVALTVLVAFMYLMMGILDFARGRIMGRIGAQFQADLDERVFNASMRANASGRSLNEAATGLRDLQAVQQSITSPVAMAKFDLPWTAVFLIGIFIFHTYLGYVAMAGGAMLVGIAAINQISTKRPLEDANVAALRAERLGAQLRDNAENVQALGMRASAFQRWIDLRRKSLRAGIRVGDVAGGFGGLTKALRLFLQSMMLGMGAYLVLRDELTAGAMIAASILLGRALAPVELLVNQWSVLDRGRIGWANLAHLLGALPQLAGRIELPVPKASIVADQVTILPPNDPKARLRMVSFVVNPGEAVGVIGPSGAGKSTLARALVGLWAPAGGTIRLDGASLDQYEPDVLGSLVGYLPQNVMLLDGTIRDNIARMSVRPDDSAVIRAAKRAAAHDMILKLPNGYNTVVNSSGAPLSGGQVQRIGLARAMYGDPVYLVLDEPNSNLDNEGVEAVNNAIRLQRKEGGCAFVMAHRPAAIEQCNKLMYLDGGLLRAFGPTEQVKSQILVNYTPLNQRSGIGGARA